MIKREGGRGALGGWKKRTRENRRPSHTERGKGRRSLREKNDRKVRRQLDKGTKSQRDIEGKGERGDHVQRNPHFSKGRIWKVKLLRKTEVRT